MGEQVAIVLNNVSKCYKRYKRPIDRLKEILRPNKNYAQEFWALQDINLEINQGETIGIIGQNGSGKSTLLQIIAGTLTPTTGNVFINGRVSALLELGSGFNPEFTGRQNVFFNGRILGLTYDEIAAKFADIAAFAEIGDFIDQPVKTYSSGMVVRLAFAVVANTDPKILIVDEALAVGDAKFQARCMKRIRQMKEQGVTILFVSHDSASVKMLCQRALLMSHGRIVELGEPKDVVNRYIALLSTDNAEEKLNKEQEPQLTDISANNGKKSHQKDEQPELLHRHGNKLAVINEVKVTSAERENINSYLETGEILSILVTLEAKAKLADLVVGISIRNLLGIVIYGTNTKLNKVELPILNLGEHLTLNFEMPCCLNNGVYTVTVGIHSEEGFSYDWIDELVVFEVKNSRLCDGIIDMNSGIKIKKMKAVSVKVSD